MESSDMLYGNVRAQYIHQILHRNKDTNNGETNQYTENKFVPHIIKKKKQPKKCYTCFPKKYVKNFQFHETGQLIFHFDMLKRPFIIVTPKKHIITTFELDAVELHSFFEDIKQFIKNRDILNYQLITNGGEWKTHDHLHWKIKIDEDIYYRMKKDHFSLISRQKDYSAES